MATGAENQIGGPSGGLKSPRESQEAEILRLLVGVQSESTTLAAGTQNQIWGPSGSLKRSRESRESEMFRSLIAV